MLSEKPWKAKHLILVLPGIYISFSMIVLLGLVAQHLTGKPNWDQGSLAYLLLQTMSIHGSILIAAGVALRWYRLNWQEAFGISKLVAKRAIFWGVLAAVIFLPVGILLQGWSQEIIDRLPHQIITRFHLNEEQQAIQSLEQAVSWGSLAYFIMFSVLIAPLAEEILFRGILYPVIKQAGFPRLAWWGTAFLFAAIHMNWAKFLPLFALGMMFVWLYERTNTLLASITAHGVFNGINLVIFFLQQNSAHRLQ